MPSIMKPTLETILPISHQLLTISSTNQIPTLHINHQFYIKNAEGAPNPRKNAAASAVKHSIAQSNISNLIGIPHINILAKAANPHNPQQPTQPTQTLS
jgi:hypothetical protein